MDTFDWFLKERVLKGAVLSEEWINICELASPLNFFDLGEITALVEMPCELGTLVVKDSGCFTTEDTPWETVEKWLNIHRFMGAELKLHASGMVSLVAPTFCLALVPDTHSTLWINPLHIDQLYCGNEGVLVELDNGLCLDSAINCHDFLQHAVETVYLFKCQKNGGSLRLPTTPFGYYLEKQLRAIDGLLHKESDLVKKFLVCPQALNNAPSCLFFTVDDVAPSPCTTTA